MLICSMYANPNQKQQKSEIYLCDKYSILVVILLVVENKLNSRLTLPKINNIFVFKINKCVLKSQEFFPTFK